MLLNRFAHGTYEGSIKRIGALMTVRNVRFLQTRLRYSKAPTTAPIASQVARTGSIATARFTGWAEQELGKRTNRSHWSEPASRGGDKTRQMKPSSRLKPGNRVVRIEDYHPSGGNSNYGGFIAMLIRRKENRLVMIRNGGYGRLKRGVWKRNRKRLEMMQSLKTKQPKRLRWLSQARAIYFKSTNIPQVWEKICNQLVRPPGKS